MHVLAYIALDARHALAPDERETLRIANALNGDLLVRARDARDPGRPIKRGSSVHLHVCTVRAGLCLCHGVVRAKNGGASKGGQ